MSRRKLQKSTDPIARSDLASEAVHGHQKDQATEAHVKGDSIVARMPSVASPGLRELARELGRLAARSELHRTRRGAVAVLDPWTALTLSILLAVVAVWIMIGR